MASKSRTATAAPPDQRLLLPREVAEILGYSVRTLQRLVAANEIEHVRLRGRSLRFKREHVQAYIDSHGG